VVTAFKFRVRPYTQKIWAGPILLPNTKEVLLKIAKGIVSMHDGPNEPKVAMFLYMMRKEIIQAMGGKDDMLVVHAFDALGEEHGRKTFAWALNIDGALDRTGIMNLRGVAEMQREQNNSPSSNSIWAKSYSRRNRSLPRHSIELLVTHHHSSNHGGRDPQVF